MAPQVCNVFTINWLMNWADVLPDLIDSLVTPSVSLLGRLFMGG